ncbi:S-layer homology domain-containing protein [Paenibacillus marinisediminis]
MRIRGLMMCVLVSMVSLILLPSSNTYASEEFKDTANHWAKSAIVQAAEERLLTGYEDGTFRPNASISRAEFTAIVARLLELQAGSSESTAFEDIAGNWAEGAISSAVQAGVIVSSEFGSKFEPTKAITRLEMAKMIGRSLALQADYELYLESFKGLYNGDIPVTDWKKIKAEDVPLVGLAYGSGVIGGYPDDSFGLDKNATRAEATVMLLILKDAKGKNPEEFMALKELKAVAETGTNLSAVVDRSWVHRDIVKEPVLIDHPNYSAKVKRVYIVPTRNDVTQSIYHKKFIGDHSKSERPAMFEGTEGRAVAIAEVTPKYSGGSWDIIRSLKFARAGNPVNMDIAKKFNYIDPTTNGDHLAAKGITEEWAFYGVYNRDEFENLRLLAENATKGSHTYLYQFLK